MAYKPKQIKSTYGPQGVAKVALSADKKKVRVIFKDEEGDTKPIDLTADNCPDYVQKGTFNVRLSSDKKKMYSMTPLNGVYKSSGSHVTIRHAKDEKPAPKADNFNNLCFNVDVEITAGPCKGMTASYSYSGLHYNFLPVEEDGKSVVGIKGKGSYTKALIEFCDCLGVWDKGAIAWSDNILPIIQKRIIAVDREFQFIIKTEEKTTKSGDTMTLTYIDGILPADDDDEETENEEVTEPAPKSKKASEPKKSSKKPVEDDEDDELPWSEGDEPDDVEDEDNEEDDDFDE